MCIVYLLEIKLLLLQQYIPLSYLQWMENITIFIMHSLFLCSRLYKLFPKGLDLITKYADSQPCVAILS